MDTFASPSHYQLPASWEEMRRFGSEPEPTADRLWHDDDDWRRVVIFSLDRLVHIQKEVITIAEIRYLIVRSGKSKEVERHHTEPLQHGKYSIL